MSTHHQWPSFIDIGVAPTTYRFGMAQAQTLATTELQRRRALGMAWRLAIAAVGVGAFAFALHPSRLVSSASTTDCHVDASVHCSVYVERNGAGSFERRRVPAVVLWRLDEEPSGTVGVATTRPSATLAYDAAMRAAAARGFLYAGGQQGSRWWFHAMRRAPRWAFWRDQLQVLDERIALAGDDSTLVVLVDGRGASGGDARVVGRVAMRLTLPESFWRGVDESGDAPPALRRWDANAALHQAIRTDPGVRAFLQ